MKTLLRVLAAGMLLVFAGCDASNPESEFRAAEKENTIEAYQGFIETYPDSELVDRAGQEVCFLKFDAAVETKTFEAFETLLNECTEESERANEQTAMLMGRVVGRFVSSEDGAPLDYQPGLFHVFKEMSEAELVRATRFQEQYGVEVRSSVTEGFQISNVYPGRYYVTLPGDILGSEFEVKAGEKVDVGDIEVPVKR